MKPIQSIWDRSDGPDRRAYVIAELSGNHHGSETVARDLVIAAQNCGADAVKVQTATPACLTLNSDAEAFRIGGGTLWDGRTLFDLYREVCMPWDWQPRLMELARTQGMDFFSTPFSATAVEFLETMQVPAHKIASFELVDTPLLQRVAATHKPVIMSIGMATLAEIDEAVRTLREGGCTQLALLKCTSSYPAPPEEMNLRTIPHLAEAFGVPVGLSDHTLGITTAVASVALGACIIEKHLTLRRSDGGPDAAFSLEPAEFKAMVDAVRETEKALGRVHYEVTGREAASRVFRRSLFVVEDVKAGEVFTERNVRSIRPGYGLPPKHLDLILNRRAACDIARGTPLNWHLVGQ